MYGVCRDLIKIPEAEIQSIRQEALEIATGALFAVTNAFVCFFHTPVLAQHESRRRSGTCGSSGTRTRRAVAVVRRRPALPRRGRLEGTLLERFGGDS
jgi:hypothetical protein